MRLAIFIGDFAREPALTGDLRVRGEAMNVFFPYHFTVVGLIVAWLLFPSMRHHQSPMTTAYDQLWQLGGAIDNHAAEQGIYPASNEALKEVATKYLMWKRLPLDPWGNPYLYRSVKKNKHSFLLWSNGPDKKPYTGDDIAYVSM